MKPWGRFVLCGVAGVVLGSGAAIYAIRGGMADSNLHNGAWSTGRDFGSVNADALTRARVALSGLLALPRDEAMYFNASTDSAGKPLDGRCAYTIRGGALAARWWSLTLYDPAGYLIANRWQRYSVGSGAVPRADDWTIIVAAQPAPGLWIPAPAAKRFELTLRAYHPGAALLDRPETVALPVIERGECAA